MPLFSWKSSSSDSSPDNKKQQVSDYRRTEQEANPFAGTENQHKSGQPIIPNLDEDGKQRTKFATDCSVQHRASLACIEDNYTTKETKCQQFFQAYKQCRREERERRLEANSKRSFFS
mmetsp:Transcript_26539/g.40172  ORF Transcript_26539/g.40172 Transcript_26539/m.40172 type:complete len:118 (-) Transcript_26539:1111-1464(-)|eukprot:CAMPEP_0178930048 /NCGR_PEP_ID=MMETSP0786-20121207/20995_1 /TAXON_ID=186022 /ORGANISM="Thalassionema frauenfeldii, Strain CCMP 1798" /LENGTH=117 /DNA_ID=CAMNT_0020606485 /DNA_START=154 /DNA_END=507 /DNA_ORIENTATION=+